ncbi:MAG: extracellular solute-binding protein family 1, partial [Paenibacillus sp.]|nr:extracellular solute-binding protein family 1 [Paenibacillus sp.]
MAIAIRRARQAAVWFTATLLVSGCLSSAESDLTQPPKAEQKEPVGGETAGGGKFRLGQDPLAFSLFGNYDWYAMQPWGGDPATRWIKEHKQVSVTNIASGGKASQAL